MKFLTLKDREIIEKGLKEEIPIRDIAKSLKRHVSVIYAEIQRYNIKIGNNINNKYDAKESYESHRKRKSQDFFSKKVDLRSKTSDLSQKIDSLIEINLILTEQIQEVLKCLQK